MMCQRATPELAAQFQEVARKTLGDFPSEVTQPPTETGLSLLLSDPPRVGGETRGEMLSRRYRHLFNGDSNRLAPFPLSEAEKKERAHLRQRFEDSLETRE